MKLLTRRVRKTGPYTPCRQEIFWINTDTNAKASRQAGKPTYTHVNKQQGYQVHKHVDSRDEVILTTKIHQIYPGMSTHLDIPRYILMDFVGGKSKIL